MSGQRIMSIIRRSKIEMAALQYPGIPWKIR